MIKFAFWGTDEFSIGVAEALKVAGFLPALVVTMPDRPVGRHQMVTPPLLKVWAEKENIPVIQPVSLKDPDTIYNLQNTKYDVFIVASYGKIIPETVLNLTRAGTLNVHPSLLPKYRGPTPIEASILNGDTETGVSIMLLDKEMDHGPIIAQETFSLYEDIAYPELGGKLAQIGGELLAKNLEAWIAGKITPIEQDHTQATFTKKITKEDGLINLTDDPTEIFRKFRAYNPWPGIHFFVKHNEKDLRVIIKQARLDNGALVIESVLPEGKKEMDWTDFEKGYLIS